MESAGSQKERKTEENLEKGVLEEAVAKHGEKLIGWQATVIW